MLRKIKFLIKIKAPKKIFIAHLKHFFFEKITKLQKLKEKNKYLLFLRNKKITIDWFSKNCYHFLYIKKFIKKNFNYLEIGSFEGNSLMYVLKNFNTNLVCAVDTWTGSEEHQNLDMKLTENNFNYNLKEFVNKFTKEKKTSDEFFKTNKLYFDLIYIDGDHEYKQVLKDCKNSWRILNKNGIMIFDDYFWEYYSDIFKNPGYAINHFLQIIKNQYKVILVTNTKVFIKKI